MADSINEMIRRQRTAATGERALGVLDRLRGATPLADDRQERLNVQLSAYEDATRRGDHIAAQMADEKIEALLSEARAARQETQRQTNPPAPSFDGGFRGRRGIAPPANVTPLETSSQLLSRALRQRVAERAEQ